MYLPVLDALYSSTNAPIPALIGVESCKVEDPAAFEGKEALISPLTEGGMTFVWGMVQDEIDAESWRAEPLAPTVVLYDQTCRNLILVWAFNEPAHEADVADICAKLGMDGADDPIPLPPTNGFQLIHVDVGNSYTLDELREQFLPNDRAVNEGEPEQSGEPGITDDDEVVEEIVPKLGRIVPKLGRIVPKLGRIVPNLGTYVDATIKTPYSEDNPALHQMMTISVGGNKESKHWKTAEMPIGAFVAKLCKHEEGKKDGFAFVLGDMVPGRRLKTAVKALYGIGLDIDTGTPTAQIDAALAKLGAIAVRASTHSHLKTRSEFKKDRITKFAQGEEIDDELIRKFLTTEEHWDQSIVDEAVYMGTDHTDRGIMAMVEHPPMPKHRVMVPLLTPFVIEDEGATQNEAMAKWAKVPTALAELLGVPLDRSCTDPSRLFYFPRHAKGRPHDGSVFGGELFDWRTLKLDNAIDKMIAEVGKGKGKSTTEEGRELGRWSMKRAHGFQIVDAIEAHCDERIRGKATSGVDIECPFDDEHNNAGDQDDRACFAVNAGDGPSDIFTISCRHDSCRGRTNLDMLGKMIKDGWFDKEVLEDENFNTAEPEDAPNPEVAVKIAKQDDAKKGYEQQLAVLTKDSDNAEVEECIQTIVDAGLGERQMFDIENDLQKKLCLKAAQVSKLIKTARRKNVEEDKADRHDHLGRTIFYYTGEFNFDEACVHCYKALKNANEKEGLPVFSHVNGSPVRLNPLDPAGRLSFDELNSRSLGAELNELTTFIRKSEQGDGARGAVPPEVSVQVFETCYKSGRVPPAPEIIYTPVFVDDDTLVDKAGWYPDRQLLLAETKCDVGEIPEMPSAKEALEAAEWIRYNLLSDFPFLDYDEAGNKRREPSEANAFAMILTPFMRRMIRGNTPVFFISKPQEGTGGTFLGTIPILLFDGTNPEAIQYTQSEEEMSKALLSEVLKGNSHLFFDDVREFNNRVLLRSITATYITGRILGSTKNASRPNTFNWIGTGNNPVIHAEMERRICWIRLNAERVDIQNRQFLHPDLNKFIMTNRGQAIRNILTMIQYWITTGKVPFKQRKRASFEDWSEKVGGVLQACGIEGFLDNRRTAAQEGDAAAQKEFAREFLKKYGLSGSASSKELFDWAFDMEFEIVDGNNDDQKKSRFMARLPKLDGRAFRVKNEDYILRSKTDGEDGTVFFMEKLVVEADQAA